MGRTKGGGKLTPYRAVLIAKVEVEPDITMLDLASFLLDEHGASVDPSNRACRKLLSLTQP